MVAHPLQLVAHVVEREQEPEVAGDRRLGGDRPGDQARDLALHLVDPAVGDDHLGRRARVVGEEGGDARPDRLLDVGAHPEDVVLDLAHLEIERLAGRLPDAGRGGRARGVGEDRPHLPLDLLVRQPVFVGHRCFPSLSRTGRRRSPR
jgi:hypothetical protein